MFKKLSLSFLSSAIFLLSFGAQAECPLGKGEQTLTIHRVMRNFGRFTVDADMVALRGVDPNETVTNKDLQVAATKLGYVIDCAQAVIDHPAGDLLPDKGQWLHGQEQQGYINDLVYFMTDFRDLVIDYRNLLQQALAQQASARNYQPIRAKSAELEDMVMHAHKKL